MHLGVALALDGLGGLRAELLVGERLAPVSHDGGAERQHAVTAEIVQRRHELAMRQVAGDAEDDEAAGVWVTLAAER